MKPYRGSLLMEVMVVIVLMGVFISMSSKGMDKKFEPSYREAPVILMGCLNEERRDTLESMKSNQLRIENGKITHWNHLRRLKKTVFIDENISMEFEGDITLRIATDPDFTIRIIDVRNQSGRLNILKNNKLDSHLMIHLGSSTMDLRKY